MARHRRLRSTLACGAALLTMLCVTASAGPFEDASAAMDKKDYATAARIFGEAAAKGDAHAQTMLGIMYELGLGMPADARAALQWLSLAADSGDAGGQATLGEMYASGRGIPRDYAQALKYYTLAAKQNDAVAQYRIGKLYYDGGGVPQDYNKAAQWYQLAAKAGNDDAQFGLGFMYFYGIGTAKNFAAAVAWLKQAVAQDNRGAETLLGFAYDNGYGVPQGYAIAIRFYKHAAQRGGINAMGLLGEKYYNGQGTAQDWAKAYLLLSMAVTHTEGNTREALVKERDTAQSHLGADQIAKLQATASDCEQSDYARCPIDELRPPALRAADGHTMELYATGSGFFISKAGYLITNNHVVRECSEVHLDGRSLKVVNVDAKADLALLLDAKKPGAVASLRGGKGPRLGEAVVAMGYPLHQVLSGNIVVTTGVISSLQGLEADGRQIQISAPIQPGNSGGPVLGEDGAVVGVVVSVLDAVKYASVTGELPQNVNFAVSLAPLRALLAANKIAYAASDSGARKDTAEISAAGASYTVLLECWK